MSSLITRQTNLPAHIVQFCRYLRSHRFNCGPEEEMDVLKAIAANVPDSQEAFLHLLGAVLVKNKGQFLRFPELFWDYWSQLQKAEDSKVSTQAEERNQPKPANQPPSLQELKDWLFDGRQSTDTEEIAAFSAADVFTQKDFSAFDDREVEDIMRLLRPFANLLARKQVRRSIRAKQPRQIDLRNSVRKNISRGGEIDYLLWKKPKPSRQKITLFCDVSKSMDLYARFLIQFMYGFHSVSAQLETFVFSTTLTRISTALK
ncbi:MAG: VWA domain-containing protein, partial [Bacteroidota bacterium]